MSAFLGWYLASTFLGWLAFPLAYRLLPGLYDRGFALSRTLGLLLTSYLFWLLAALGMLHNTAGGILLAAALLAGLSLWALLGIHPAELLAFIKSRRAALLVAEILFLAAFAFLTIVRAANPEAAGTEKPMELAFINAILRSPTFPPHDPWLSGYSISYYYFGYVMVALLARLTGVAGSVAFNLGLALVFALSASGAYGLALNLLAAWRSSRAEPGRSADQPAPRPDPIPPLIGPLFLLLVSNLEGFLQVLHRRGLFWSSALDGTLQSSFWRWLAIKDLDTPPAQPFAWVPDRFWWWWRASRVLQDYDLNGSPREIIDEFPFFSYLLGDLHPHVLAMPFAFLAMGLALNLFLGGGRGRLRQWQGQLSWRLLAVLSLLGVPLGAGLVAAGLLQARASLAAAGVILLASAGLGLLQLIDPFSQHGIKLVYQSGLGGIPYAFSWDLNPAGFLLAAVALGGMAFLNIWDLPISVAIVAGAYALRPRRMSVDDTVASARQMLLEFIGLGLAFGVAGGVLYLPFYLAFSSQAGGLLPNLIYPTRGAHLWVMFAPLLLPIFAYLLHLTYRRGWSPLWSGLKLAGGLMLLLWLAALLLGGLITLLPQIGDFYLSSLGAADRSGLLGDALLRRLVNPGGWLTLLALLSLAAGLLVAFVRSTNTEASGFHSQPARPEVFGLLLVTAGTLLVLAPEFFYLRDLFGWRMNTIFKFYYQAWLIWSAAAAFACLALFASLKGLTRLLFTAGLFVLLAAALVYPILSLPEKTSGFSPLTWTLDSASYFARQYPAEWAAIRWLQDAPLGTLAEAVPQGGGSYTEYARAATFSGQPGMMGWVGHENQWRGSGGAQAIGPRQADLERLFCGRDWPETQDILEHYQIRYVFVGGLERSTYSPKEGGCPVGLNESKFLRNLTPVFQQEGVTIYEYIPARTP